MLHNSNPHTLRIAPSIPIAPENKVAPRDSIDGREDICGNIGRRNYCRTNFTAASKVIGLFECHARPFALNIEVAIGVADGFLPRR